MNTLEAILTRRSIRQFSNREIAKSKLAKILEAGRFSPSPENSQPWQLIVVQDKNTLGKLQVKAYHGHFLDQAKVLIAVLVDNQIKIDDWLIEHQQHTLSAACLIQNMWLSAWDLGIGACWVSLDQKLSEKVLECTGKYAIIGGLALGYPKLKLIHPPHQRKKISQIVSSEKFGRPFSV